ncbi:3-hydroxyacyl-CoA dehydrogenase NAD-binding domain-containing protein [Pseudomonas sp. CR3202]|uniref:3-hydroxyacyl-CoA dehydrogenase NAD-binding domain-containing protein n=1 Tax=Pseudomonas sp. CR3202 TaxID=3351532 RepID=UPI003BF1BAF7
MSHYQLKDGVAVIVLDNPPVNALALALRLRLADAVHSALNDPEANAVVLTGAGRGFCGGGDITEFDLPALSQAPTLMALFSLIERSPKPVVAALHGNALGGGLELALACHARVAQSKTQVGLPEVHLGLVPGAGGTQRLPRLVGPELALNLVLQGRTCSAQSLSESGLFDRLTDAAPLDSAVQLARELAAEVARGRSLKRAGELTPKLPNAQAFFAYARATAKAQSRGLPAPVACVDCVEYSVTLPFQEGLDREFDTFWRLRGTPEFAGLRHAFLAERKASEVAGLPTEAKPRPVERTVVIGGGTMGSGIAMSLANAGLPVTMIEREQPALDRGLASVRDTYLGALKKGRLSEQQFEQRVALINGALDYEAVKEADLVIEAVFEDLDIKRQVFEQLDAAARPGALLATNTSMLDVNRIAAFTNRPEDVIGLHFFSPAHVMKLLEVVRGERTSPAVLATAMNLARRIGKTAVVSGVCEGFIGNRMLQPYLMQAGLLLDEGALPHQIDRAIEKWGMAMGPFRVSDMAGNDLGAKIREQRLAEQPDLVYSRSFDTIVAIGRSGQKVGRGWYDYVPGQRAPVPSEEVIAAVVAESERLGLKRRAISDEEIVDRLLLALVNEGAKILEEGIAQRASDVDVVYTAGYGFPRWRGGPMFEADQRGLGDVLATMQRFSDGPAYQRCADFWRPAGLLCRLAGQGQSFATFNHSELS